MMGQQNHLTDDTPIYGSIKSIWYYLVGMRGQSVEVSRHHPDGTWSFVIYNPFGLGWDG